MTALVALLLAVAVMLAGALVGAIAGMLLLRLGDAGHRLAQRARRRRVGWLS
jgi:hypothetical protein